MGLAYEMEAEKVPTQSEAEYSCRLDALGMPCCRSETLQRSGGIQGRAERWYAGCKEELLTVVAEKSWFGTEKQRIAEISSRHLVVGGAAEPENDPLIESDERGARGGEEGGTDRKGFSDRQRESRCFILQSVRSLILIQIYQVITGCCCVSMSVYLFTSGRSVHGVACIPHDW